MRKALIVIDMQYDFIDGSLGTNEAQNILPNVKDLIDKKDYDNLFFTRDTHYKNYLETQEGKKLPVKHCIKNTHGWQIHEILNTDGAEIIDKESFGFNGWKGKLDNFDEVVLVGLCTDICVISNALIIKAFYPEIKINIVEDATAGVTPESKAAAIKTAKSCQINII